MKRLWGTAGLMVYVKLFALMVSAGAAITFVHDYAYRRADVTGTGDYEFGGFVSHAGADMLITTAVLTAVALLWAERVGRR